MIKIVKIMDTIPNEVIIEEIFPYLHLMDLHRFKICCKRLYQLKDKNSVWSNRNDIWKWIYPLLQSLKNYVVAGGQALRTFNKENWYGDFDIFFYDQSLEEFIIQCYHLFKNICKHSDLTWSWQTRPAPGAIFKYNSDIKLEDEIKIKEVNLIRLSGVPPIEEYRYPYQRKIDLVYTKYSSIKDILNDFDLPFCGVGFTIDNCNFKFMKSSIECYQSAKNKQCTIIQSNNIKEAPYYLVNNGKECNLKMDYDNVLTERIKKYTERGYKVDKIEGSIGPGFYSKNRRSIEEKRKSRQQHLMLYTL